MDTNGRFFRHVIQFMISAATASLSSTAVVAAQYTPDEKIAGTGQVCVERWEDDGALNTWPLRVSFGNQVDATLVGGRAICVYELPGTYEISIDWQDSHAKKRSGNAQTVNVSPGKSVELFICNTLTGPADNREWATGWIIQYRSKQARNRCD
jgi:hypothetical protein